MTERKNQRRDPARAKPAPAAGTLIADRVFRSSTLDEMEEVGNRMVSPHRIAPQAGGRHADARFQFHGSKDFFSLNIRYGREVSVHHPDQPDDRIAFVASQRGSCQFLRRREELDISADQGLIFSSSEPGR